jgi:flagellar hook-associated protein 2
LTIIDNRTGRTTNVALTTGMSSTDIAEALNAAFAADGLEVTATTEGNELRLTHRSSGASAGLSISVSGTGDGSSELFTGSDTQYGTDVAGTIGGQAATGLGDLLVGADGTDHAGWTVRYDGATTGSMGTVSLHAGVGAIFERMLDSVLAEATGSLAQQETALDDRSRALDASGDTVAGRLERRRAALLRQFLQMETAIARIQGQSSAIASLLPKQESR